ncbi:MAG: AbrB/MazE/SpoVT family DNA-binding domain-containing protein [Ardenticatenaceae bacterium]|nr:AbrB/MazE/SpoVT family DNA-binding domain-containing protein [Ardenticatenaceae bacterium]
MKRKVFKVENSLVVSLPKDAIQALGLYEGSEIEVTIDSQGQRLIIEPIQPEISAIDAPFAEQLEDFINRYRSALEALAK